MKEEKEMQPVSRHHGSAKRPYRLEVSFSEEEWTALVALADKAGEKKIPAFARKLLLGGGTVVARVTQEDRKDIGQLGKIGGNLWQLRKGLKNFGVDGKLISDLDNFYNEFAKILTYFRAKID